MSELVVFPDIELWATDYLRDALAARPESYASDVFVATTVPSPRRDRMVIVRRDGGPRLDAVRERARIAVRVFAATEEDVTDLARMVRALLWVGADGKPVSRVDELSGPSAIPDEQPHRYMTFELIARGTAA